MVESKVFLVSSKICYWVVEMVPGSIDRFMFRAAVKKTIWRNKYTQKQLVGLLNEFSKYIAIKPPVIAPTDYDP